MNMRLSSASILAALAVLFLTAPAHATYTIHNAAMTEGGGTASAGVYELVFTTGQGSPVGVSMSREE